ncbi:MULTISPECIES: hypothetical protein [unclassified Dehalobacter]|uniref:hypothetical protein n=1 Tax=unclassified Dehalobacter TaxID=2635733 RepID=UPI00104A6A01|nr:MULTISPECIES: hypothetical protein [unclassified Dehalobacter]TCX50648.1 hypothetical protein C1I36_08850 [Dehalobacter sp. 14DCB1]TCX51216.1 hypothetical protein C1I38_10560 [Dehalobacter sp. 12DCB1]
MKNILLVEPAYKNKYPPMGLMKISTYHKQQGDNVLFVKGIDKSVANHMWDRIYVTTLFTFDFDISIRTINYYKTIVESCSNIYVGGIMASLMKDRVIEETGLPENNILVGLFTDSSVMGDELPVNIDILPLDYDILDMIDYKYPAGDNYFAYLTRGCPNCCKFCAVPILEPQFQVTNNIVCQLKTIDELYGPKQNLLLLDNNILNAPDLSSLVDDLCQAGFKKGSYFIDPGTYDIILRRYHRGDRSIYLDKKLSKYLDVLKKRIPSGVKRDTYIDLLLDAEITEDYAEYMINTECKIRPFVDKYKSKAKKMRSVDFNQGVDARRINDKNMKQLAKLALKPLRIAFDNIAFEKLYVKSVKLAHKHGINEISNYILFNYEDKPEDLYKRLECNIKLNQELGIKIFSFPMKYSPVERTDRQYVGKHWNVKYLRSISAILHVTQGVVAAGTSFFYKAFGNTLDEYFEILAMPRDMIMFRFHYEGTGQTDQWKVLYHALSSEDKEELLSISSKTITEMKQIECPERLKEIFPFYFLKYEKEDLSKES